MKLIIDIDEQEYNLIQSLDWKNGELGYDKCWIAVHNGTPLDNENLLDKIRAEINRQEKWLLQVGYTAYNVDIALDAIKSVVAESEGEDENNNRYTRRRDCRRKRNLYW